MRKRGFVIFKYARREDEVWLLIVGLVGQPLAISETHELNVSPFGVIRPRCTGIFRIFLRICEVPKCISKHYFNAAVLQLDGWF